MATPSSFSRFAVGGTCYGYSLALYINLHYFDGSVFIFSSQLWRHFAYFITTHQLMAFLFVMRRSLDTRTAFTSEVGIQYRLSSAIDHLNITAGAQFPL